MPGGRCGGIPQDVGEMSFIDCPSTRCCSQLMDSSFCTRIPSLGNTYLYLVVMVGMGGYSIKLSLVELVCSWNLSSFKGA